MEVEGVAGDSDGVMRKRLRELLAFYDRFAHPPKSCITEPFLKEVQATCVSLIEKDGPVTLLDNEQGQLCSSYPLQIVLPRKVDSTRVGEAIDRAKYARYRQRFTVPAFTFRGNFVCRSAAPSAEDHIAASVPCNDTYEHYQRDVELLSHFSIKYIFNMMSEELVIEHGVRCCLAEQYAARELYASSPLNLCVVPYPGVKLFEKWKAKGYDARIPYDWRKCSAQLEVPKLLQRDDDEWAQHQLWDLQTLTQKYFKLILSALVRDRGGFHFGLMEKFITLLVLPSWFTSPWLMHDLKGRRAKGQEIMLFTFHFLLTVQSAEYSIHSYQPDAPISGDESITNERQAARASRLQEVHRIFLQAYAESFSATA